jgi:GWxTD domain-containing protein
MLTAATIAAAILWPSLAKGQNPGGDPAAASVASLPQRNVGRPRDKDLFAKLSADYKHWLNEDAAYIISPEERRAFLTLETDQEREQFIEEFWERWNPSPGANENLFKQEHYRRIAFANEFFGGQTTGWKSDRGRVYVLWGEPDSITTEPEGSDCRDPGAAGAIVKGVPEREIWRYRTLPGIDEPVELALVATRRNASGTPDNGSFVVATNKCDPKSTGGPTGLSDFQRMVLVTSAVRPEQPSGIQPQDMPQYRPLTAAVSARLERSQIPLRIAFDSVRATNLTSIVMLRISVPADALKTAAADNDPAISLYGRITDKGTGRIEDWFECSRNADSKEQSARREKWVSVCEKQIDLREGDYELGVAAENNGMQSYGTAITPVVIPSYGKTFGASTVMISAGAEQSNQRTAQVSKLRFRADNELIASEAPIIYWQLYNAAIDPKTGVNNVSITAELRWPNGVVESKPIAADALWQRGEEIACTYAVPEAARRPGKYEIKMTAYDRVSGATVSRTAEFSFAEDR